MLNSERLTLYLDQIRTETQDIERILRLADEELLAQSHYLKSLKYSIIIIAEAIGSTFQHILAKKFNISINGFSDAFNKAKTNRVISSSLLSRLTSFLKFRNLLVHQYWTIDDQYFLKQLRKGHHDFTEFVREASQYLKTS